MVRPVGSPPAYASIVVPVGADLAAATVTQAADRLDQAAAQVPVEDEVRRIADAVAAAARDAVPHLLALPSIARRSAQDLVIAVVQAERLADFHAALAATGVLDEARNGEELTARQTIVAALLRLSQGVAEMTTQLARIRAIEARVQAVRALDREVEWTPPAPEPEPAPHAPAADLRPGHQMALAVGTVLAVLLFLLLSRCSAGDGTSHALATHLAATWSLT